MGTRLNNNFNTSVNHHGVRDTPITNSGTRACFLFLPSPIRVKGRGWGEWGPFTHSVESLIRIYHKLKETIYYMKIENSRNWLEEKDLDFLSMGFDTEFSGGCF